MVEEPRFAPRPDCDPGRSTREHDAQLFRLYAEAGLDRLKEVNFYRPESELQAHQTSLEAYFQANPPATIKEAQSEIESLTGIKRSETQVREFLKKNSIYVGVKSA